MAPDRFVRLTFKLLTCEGTAVHGTFRNIGVGPAFNLRHGIAMNIGPGQAFSDADTALFTIVAGLREGEYEYEDRGTPKYRPYQHPNYQNWHQFKVSCEYENRFGDRYRVDVPFKKGQNGFQSDGCEELYVANGSKDKPTWTRVI